MGEITNRDRWLASLAYVPFLVFIPTLTSSKSSFLAKHCRQGFVLLFAEIAGWAFMQIIDMTLGQIPVLGFILAIILRLAFFLLFLCLCVLGFIKALFGEEWRVPFLDELADRVPIE